jgi:hypothetical protein
VSWSGPIKTYYRLSGIRTPAMVAGFGRNLGIAGLAGRNDTRIDLKPGSAMSALAEHLAQAGAIDIAWKSATRIGLRPRGSDLRKLLREPSLS